MNINKNLYKILEVATIKRLTVLYYNIDRFNKYLFYGLSYGNVWKWNLPKNTVTPMKFPKAKVTIYYSWRKSVTDYNGLKNINNLACVLKMQVCV